MTEQSEQTLITEHPSMFRNRPILFIFFCILIPFGIGLLFLGIWYLRCVCTTLSISNKRTTLRSGILSKHTTEVRHQDIRNLAISQSIFQRMFNVGTIALSSAGQADMEIIVSGIRKPQKTADTIRQYQN